MAEPPVRVESYKLREGARDCAVLVLAAGFERRARRILELLGGQLPPRLVVVRYKSGIRENEVTFEWTMARLSNLLIQSEVSRHK
jgi:hypothetical protein